jgi:DNA-binding NarL/FixJ family response regulator
MRRVLVVDDHVLTRMGMVQFVRHLFNPVEVGEADCALKALELVRQQAWDLMLLDVDLPDRSGLDILGDVKRARPKMPVLFVSGFAEEEFALRAMRGGACGFVEKTTNPEELRKALTTTIAGGRYISGGMSGKLAFHALDEADQSPAELLSDREFQVLRHLGAGKTVSEVAQILSLSVKTVSTYRARLLEKLNLHSTSDLVRYALKKGLVK